MVEHPGRGVSAYGGVKTEELRRLHIAIKQSPHDLKGESPRGCLTSNEQTRGFEKK